MKATHALHRSNLMWPNRTATIMGDRVKTWHEVSERVGKLAGGLRNLNVKENDRVAILALNSDRYYEYYFGVWWAGAVAVPMNVRWSGRESTFILNDCDARVLFIDTNHVHLLGDIRLGAANLEYVVFIDDGPVPDGCIGYETLLADSSWIADRCAKNEAMAAIFYTGGSTGFPKGAVLSHRSIVCNGLFAAKAYRMDQEDHLCHATPMFHLSDGTVNFAANSVGMAHSFIPSFTAGAMLDALGSGLII